jgi:ribosomal protein S18 acetylase RimI-like enzyme
MGRLLVLDDDAARAMPDLLDRHPFRVITVLDAATESQAWVGGSGRYEAREEATAMTLRDLDVIKVVGLPHDLELRYLQSDEELDAAIATCLRYDEGSFGDESPETLIRSALTSLQNPTILAAVDSDGRVHATAASGAFGDDAVVIFVTTDPALRGRGIGTAMTTAALHAAHVAGARRACLDASVAGESIYRRLGFTPIARVNLNIRTAPA